MSTSPQDGSQPAVVLVHGGFVDGSGWQGVYNQLKDDYSVRIVQNPTLHSKEPSRAKISSTRGEPYLVAIYGGAVFTGGMIPRTALVYMRHSC